jgi:hypothetical protein
MEWLAVLPSEDSSGGRRVKLHGSENRLPRFRIRACSALVRSEITESADSRASKSQARKELLSVNSLPSATFVSRVSSTTEISSKR